MRLPFTEKKLRKKNWNLFNVRSDPDPEPHQDPDPYSRRGSAEPDPDSHQNEADPKHCCYVCFFDTF